MSGLQNLVRFFFLVLLMVSCKQWEYEKVDFIELDTGQVTATSSVSIEMIGSIAGLDGGSVQEHGHCWSVDNSMPTIDNARKELGSRATNGAFVSQLTGLLPDQSYFIRAYAIYQGQAVYGETKSIATSAIQLELNRIDYDGNREALLTASITDLPLQLNLLNHGFCWSNEIETPTIEQNDGLISLGAISGKSTFNAPLAKLQHGLIYHIRPFILLLDRSVIYGDPQVFNAQLSNIWTLKNEFKGEARSGAVGFSIGQRAYVGLGIGDNVFPFLQDFWEYDPIADCWTPKKDFEGGPREGAIGLVINNKGYVGLGSNGQSYPGKQKDLWEYDPEEDDWIIRDSFPGSISSQAVAFVIGDKAYVGTGLGKDLFDNQKEFWEYDPKIDKWTEKKPFEGGARTGAVGFAIGEYGYLGFGGNEKGALYDFYRYDPKADDWDEMSSPDDVELIFNAASFNPLKDEDTSQE